MEQTLAQRFTLPKPLRTKRDPVEIEKSLDQLSNLMDGVFRIPGVGWRFGLDAVVGLIPGIGDTATTLVSVYILAAAVRYRVPKVTLLRMAANIGIDYLLGAVPVVGDIFDAFWKSNQMNVELLKSRATVSSEEARRGGKASDWLFLGLIVLVLMGILGGSLAITFLILQFVAHNLSSALGV
jgi:hypothetical protein